ncbi:helix-turn-helix transcriptional regulator [Streptomyces violascens]|uniref:helix-turn-helix transcriptional regulator n=1 Tax=Streptomyces violascens TaxID=67381 RepID=UPI003656B2FC
MGGPQGAGPGAAGQCARHGSRKAVARRARTWSFNLSGIAGAAGCSRRTITSAFRGRLGISPGSYVRNRRLDRIREDIPASTDPVGTIAHRWGVSPLGRFAGEYRAHFAELPSHTATRRWPNLLPALA